MRYLDSATRHADQTAHAWLAQQLPDATVFACQSGYFRFDALLPFIRDIDRLLRTGGRFDLVVGANEDVLRAPDLEDVLHLLGPWLGTTATATLVAAGDALFHPKTIYVERSAGRRAALVGSGNLTGAGTRNNVEAAIALDERDDVSVLDAIRDAILAWPQRATAGGHARPITQRLVDELTTAGAVIPTRLPLGQPRKPTRSRFPRLGRIPGTPVPGRPPRPRIAAPIVQLGRRTVAFPPGVTGIVKRLSRTDSKGFYGRVGTPHIALSPNPADHAARLPMRLSGANAEPRLNVALEARLDGALRQIATSANDVASITHVGAGASQVSHRDLRLNIPQSVIRELIAVATRRRLSLPSAGDAVAIELLDRGRLVRLTFASSGALRATLLGYLQPNRSWGWLPANVLPPW